MFKWEHITKHFDGHENGYNLTLSHVDAYYPTVDEHEYHYVRFTESGEAYGATEDFMYISDNVTQQYLDRELNPQLVFDGLKALEEHGVHDFEDITDEFREYHDLDDSVEN